MHLFLQQRSLKHRLFEEQGAHSGNGAGGAGGKHFAITALLPSVHLPDVQTRPRHCEPDLQVAQFALLKQRELEAGPVIQRPLLQTRLAHSSPNRQREQSFRKQLRREILVLRLHLLGIPLQIPFLQSDDVAHKPHSFVLKHFALEAGLLKVHRPLKQSLVLHCKLFEQPLHSLRKHFFRERGEPSLHFRGRPEQIP